MSLSRTTNSKNVDDTTLDAIARSVRALSADATRIANSGHPGLPLGLAELGALLFAEVLNYNPANPDWINRDRLVLSAGHGSMWLYSLLHLSGYALPLKELKQFRQLGSKTPGHPEYGHTKGVETTTGPLGAGFSNAVGMAIAERMLSDTFSSLIDHYTYVIAGDGCMMEGISSEASSLAGHLKLGKLIALYDSNSISIEGSTDLAFTENTAKRYESYGWHVVKADAHKYGSLRTAINSAKTETTRPSIVICKSIIGKGAPTLAGTAATHGAPLPVDEIRAMRKKLGLPLDKDFYIDPRAQKFFDSQRKVRQDKENKWNKRYNSSSSQATKLKNYLSLKSDSIKWPKYKVGESIATRKANGACLQAISDVADFFAGGSADLEPSNNTKLPKKGSFQATRPAGRMLHYGVREHAMGGIVNGMTLHGGLKAFGATFLVFADYMRPALRLASIMRIPSLFVFTHDSIFVGEDGPTHQPVEHIPSLRAIPYLRVYRPADAQESVIAWKSAYGKKKDPSALLFTRQNLTVFDKPKDWEKDATKGAYCIKKQGNDITLVATGSEVNPVLEAATMLKKDGYNIRVVSMLCKELFDEQPREFKEKIIPKASKVIVIEAASPLGWDSIRPLGHVGIDGFGACGPAKKLEEYFGLSSSAIAKRIKEILKKN